MNGIWIRAYSKLVFCTKVYIVSENECEGLEKEPAFVHCIYGNDGVFLRGYDSEDTAFGVLEDIQRLIDSGDKIFIMP